MAVGGQFGGVPGSADRALPLLERQRELEQVGGFVDGVLAGRGGVAVIGGVAGVGKTRLLTAAGERAGAAGARVLVARCSELEQGFAFGVVRQLFEPVLHARSGPDRDRLLHGAGSAGELLLHGPGPVSPGATSAADALFGVLHGLYWLVVNLSDEAPVLMLVDDLQWADDPSRRFLAFCGSRLDEVPAGIVVTSRSGTRSSEATLPLAGLPGVVEVRPAPLSCDAAARVLHDVLGEQPDAGFAQACWQATGGVPFYVHELAGELARQGIRPHRANAARVAEVRPDSLVRTVVARLAGLPEAAALVARALAVLGGRADPAEITEVAAVAGVDLATMGRAHQQLAAAGLLEEREFAFVHPILAGSVYADIPVVQRGQLHAAAARILRAGGAPADRVAVQLLHAPAAGEADTVQVLRAAATDAMARGAVGDAVPLLRRALAEPPAPTGRAQVLLDLGTAELSAGLLPDAVQHLRAALATTTSPSQRGQIALVLGRALAFGGQLEQMAQLADKIGTEVQATDPELALRLELDFMTAARAGVSTVPLVLERIPGLRARAGISTSTGRFVLAWLALHEAVENRPARLVDDHARLALGEGLLVAAEPSDSLNWLPLHALILVDDFDLAGRGIAKLAAAAQGRGSIAGLGLARLLGALLNLRRGALRDAETDACEALAITRDHQPGLLPMAVAVSVETLVERGDIGHAEQLINEPIPAQFTAHTGFYHHYLAARGLVLMAQCRWREALDQMLDVGRRQLDWQAVNPANLAWRSRAALAGLALNDRDSATRLADDELRLAEAFGAPRTVAVALHAAALVAGGEQGVALLERAVDVLEGTGINLERARVLIDLGAMLRHRGVIRPARDRLRAGLDLAVRCGATPLAERARQELYATGARPRRPVLTGLDALTATERRISQLAAQGLSNREIAQTLFVTVKTVELHLTNSYRKLQVSQRSQLSAALAGYDRKIS